MKSRLMHTVVTAAIASAVTMAAPAIAHGVQHALFAHDSDKVDGKHAVGARASGKQRAGKLVATDSRGRLPNGIIAKAPDAAKLGGVPAAKYLTSTFIPFHLGVGGAAFQELPGPFSATCESDGITMRFTAPRDGELAMTDGAGSHQVFESLSKDSTVLAAKLGGFQTRISTWLWKGVGTGFVRYLVRYTHASGGCDGSVETVS